MSQSRSLQELQRLCSENKALLPEGFRCGGKGVTRALLLEQLELIGALNSDKSQPKTIMRDFEPSTSVETGLDWEELSRRRQVGGGFYGEVYEVEYSEQIFALKILDGTRDVKFNAFVNECSILVRLAHPNIVNIIALGVTTRRAYIMMPLYESNLESLVKRKSLTPREILKYAYDIVSAVAYIHARDIAHLDIKLQNFLYDSKSDSVLLADFGVSQTFVCLRNAPLKAMSVIHAPPEQHFGDRGARGLEVDVWGVGIVILQLTGERIDLLGNYATAIQQLLGTIPTQLWRLPSSAEKVKRSSQLNTIRTKMHNKALFQLCLAMLVYDPTKRISMQAALRNPVFDSVRSISNETESLSCLDNLYIRRLLRPESPFPLNNVTHADVDAILDWIISLSTATTDIEDLYLTRHIFDEAIPDDLHISILPVYTYACWQLSSVFHGSVALYIPYVIDRDHSFTEKEFLKQVAKVTERTQCDLVLATAHHFIVYYASEYPENEREALAALANLIGLYYLFCDTYYMVEAYEIAASAIFYASRVMGLQYRLEHVVAASNVIPPNIYHISVTNIINKKFSEEVKILVALL